MGLADNDIYYDNTPENVLDLIDAVTEAVEAGDIEIISAFGDSPAAVDITCDEMPAVEFDATEFLGG